jgi:GTP cyclohydrolase II
MLERLSKKRVLNLDHFYLSLRPTVSIALIPLCHTRFSVENRMHLICVPGSQFHTYDRLMSVISQDIAQNVQKKFINFYYTHEGRHEGLYTNNDNYEDATPSSSSTGF